VIDTKGQLYHEGGVVDSPGLYALGLSVLRRRRSTFICGIEDDAREVSITSLGTWPYAGDDVPFSPATTRSLEARLSSLAVSLAAHSIVLATICGRGRFGI
jgi:hypothetical protein